MSPQAARVEYIAVRIAGDVVRLRIELRAVKPVTGKAAGSLHGRLQSSAPIRV